MKTKIITSLCFFSIMLISCTDDKFYTSFSSPSELDGIWICVDTSDNYYDGSYSYDIKGNKLDYHEHEGYIDNNNYFVCTSDSSWEETTWMSFQYEFDAKEQAIYIGGMQAGIVTRIGKNKALFKSTTFLLRSCALQRVAGIKFSPN